MLCGCNTQRTLQQTPEVHLSSEDRRYHNMGKLFQKDLTFGGASSETIAVNAHLFQATLDVLDFMTIEDVSYQNGFVETAWHPTTQGKAKEKIKVVVKIDKGNLAVQNVHIVVLGKKHTNGAWQAFKPSAFTSDCLLDKIMKQARLLNSRTYKA